MKETIAIIAAIFAILGNVSYLRDVISKRVRPHPYTWLVWTIVSAVTFFGQVVKGAGIGSLPTGVAEAFTVIIFLFSLQYGFKHITRTDSYFLITALLGIIPWILFRDPTISVIVVVAIDLIAFIPTLRKTWQYPETEAPALYSMNVLRHILTLFSLQAYNVATMLHSLAMIMTNSFMTYLILRKYKKRIYSI